MILSSILWVVYGTLLVITSPIRLFNDVTPVSGIGSAVAATAEYLHAINDFVPVAVLLTFAGIILTIETTYATYKIIKWVYIKIPGVN